MVARRHHGHTHKSPVDFEPERWIPVNMAGHADWVPQEELFELLDRYELLDPDSSTREQKAQIALWMQQKLLPRPFGGWDGKDTFDRPIWRIFWYRSALLEHLERLKAIPGSYDRARAPRAPDIRGN